MPLYFQVLKLVHMLQENQYYETMKWNSKLLPKTNKNSNTFQLLEEKKVSYGFNMEKTCFSTARKNICIKNDKTT